MNRSRMIHSASAVAVASLLAGCATWGEMDRSEKGTAVGATGGAVVGAAVGGPVGAAVGAGVGGYVGHHQSDAVANRANARGDERVATRSPGYDARGDVARPGSSMDRYDPALIRSVQQSLNQRGYDVAIDGIWGPSSERALRAFQQANGLSQTGDLDRATLSALGVADRDGIASGGTAPLGRTSGFAQ